MRLSARKFSVEDIPLLLDWLPSREAVAQWGGQYFDYPLKPKALEKLIAQHETDPLSRQCWTVCQMNKQAAAGHFQLSFNHPTREVSLGRIIIHPNLRSSGLAKDLLKLALDKAFEIPWVHRVELRVFDFNEPAIRAYRRAGFITEGIRRECMLVGDSYWNTMIMGILRHERETPAQQSVV